MEGNSILDLIEDNQSNFNAVKKLVMMGVLQDKWGLNSPVRKSNEGKSDYSSGKTLIEPWSLWIDWANLNTWEKDILKRLVRNKPEDGMDPLDQRIMEHKKMIHDHQECIRQLEIIRKLNDVCPEKDESK